MSKRAIPKTTRKPFNRVVEDELAKFERREIALQKAERDERAIKLGLPVLWHRNSRNSEERRK